MSGSDDDPIRAAYESGGFRPRLVHTNEGSRPGGGGGGGGGNDPGAFRLEPWLLKDEKEIRHRPWIYGFQLIRGFLSLLIAPGGTGKSSYVLATLLSIATKRPLLGIDPWVRCNVGLLNLEDPHEEADRRLLALKRRYGISEREVQGRLYITPDDLSVKVAALGDDGYSVVYPDRQGIIDWCREYNIGVLAVDPFAESHALDENSNRAMISVAASWRQIARAANLAVLGSYHVRKGIADSVEAARGAKATTDSARVGLMLQHMTEEQARALEIDPDDRKQYLSLINDKPNMSARDGQVSWFKLGSVELDNADETYPFGDSVGVIEPWQPESLWARFTPRQLNDALDVIAAGPGDGQRYSPAKQGVRWVGNVLVEHLSVTELAAKTMLAKWFKEGVLVRQSYRDKAEGKDRAGVGVVDANRPTE